MLERLTIRNFKSFDEVEIELGQSVVLIGPNNSGKTSALQALALWDLGVRRWQEKRGPGTTAKTRTGVAINRRDLVSIPIPDAKLLWRDLRVRHVENPPEEKKRTENVRIEIEVRGVTDGKSWECGLEFDFANSESLYCRPLGGSDPDAPRAIPQAALTAKIAYLQPMSGLAAEEVRLEPGTVQVRLGEGRTAEVLRNLCHQLYESESKSWWTLVQKIKALFGVTLDSPLYIPERGELAMSYQSRSGIQLDLSAAGRGLQQTLLLLAHLYNNPGSILLLDEPDAHLEILRQQQIYQVLTELAAAQRCQLIAASHSEVLLNEAADRDVVVAFVGKPHRIDDRGAQVAKALKALGFENYYQAEQTGWVLYLEGSTDLAILKAFAATLRHPAAAVLERPFVHYVGNQLSKAADHFFGLREAKPDLQGVAVLDRQDPPLDDRGQLRVATWQKREIENYLCFPEVLTAYAADQAGERTVGPLFAETDRERWVKAMEQSIQDRVPPAVLRDRGDEWWAKVKASDGFLDPVFADFYRRLDLPDLMRKTDYHVLARLVPRELIDPDVVAKLDLIVEVAALARPRI